MGDPVRGQELWGLGNTIVGIFIAVLGPILGAISDRMGRRKTWLAGIVAVMAPGCMALWFAMPGAQGGLSIVVILVLVTSMLACFQISEVFHNAMLPSIALPSRIGRLSGLGLAVGNSGTLAALLIMLFGIALPASGLVNWNFLPDRPLFGLNPAVEEHNRIAGPFAGIWLLVFSIPLFLWTPDRPSTGITVRQAVKQGLGQLWLTVRQVRQVSNVGLFLLARMFYNDGKVAILAYTGIFAAGTFGWGLVEMLVFAIILTPFSISGGLLGGRIDDWLGSRRAIQISIGGTALFLVGAATTSPSRLFGLIPYDSVAAGPVWSSPYFSTLPELVYLIMFMLMAFSITAAFTSSRSMMARIAPVSMMSQFFGLYALSGSATAFLGHGTVTFFTRISNSQAVGFVSVVILLCLGLFLLHWVREERAADIIRDSDLAQ